MHIFHKRPLSLILCISLGAFVFSSFFDGVIPRIIFGSILLVCLALTFVKSINAHIPILLSRICIACALMSILASFLYFDLWFFADKRYSDEVLIEGQIEEFDTSSYRTEILLKTESIDGNSAERHKLIVYVDKNEYYGFSIGTHVELTGRIEAFSSGADFDAKSYYTARGISGVVNEVSDFRITDVGEYPLSYKITDFRNSIARRIILNSDKDTGGLFCALLLGAKEYLPKGTKLDFSRIGITHILALSGMHLAILAIGLTKLIMFFGVNKKRATVFTVIFTVLYMILTGLSVSVMRAGIMLIISSLLFLLGRTRDSTTSKYPFQSNFSNLHITICLC
ncbi:MAG: ComEC/Rec2 family competence protein [Clostridia bacterium]|nr:ComEC/Rec2 family competence protein [Clostridia bacterium]